jgi:hypothetical protein
MPNFRKLAFKDRFVWELVQTAGGETGSLAPLSFLPDAQTFVLVSFNQAEFNRVFSALMAGADLVYPEQSHQVVWDFLKFIEYPVAIPEEADLQTINLFALNATPLNGFGTVSYNASATLPFGYSMSTQNVNLHGMELTVWLKEGEYDYIGWSSLTTNGANVSVALTDGGTVIDTIIASVSQNGAFGTRVKHTGSFTVPASGFYKLVVGDLGTAGGHVTNWISHHIRRTA